MDDFAKLTLEMFMNKSAYNRYVEQTDPDKHRDHEEYLQKVAKYNHQIMNITRRYVENPELQLTLEMNDMFSNYCKAAIKYLEMKDLEESRDINRDRDEEEMMFDPFQMTEVDDSVQGQCDSVSSKRQAAVYTLDSFMRKPAPSSGF